MPLRKDNNYRGTRALHVRSHKKLGKHRTLTHASLPIVNWLIDHPEVTQVDFGRVVSSGGTQKFTHRAECNISGKKIKLILIAKNSGQSFVVTTRSEEAATAIAEEIQERWAHFQAAND